MDNRREFSIELGDWLEGIQLDFEGKKLQKQMFRIITEQGAIDCMSDEEKSLVKSVFENTMRLSFIINNNPSETEKLIKYLQ